MINFMKYLIIFLYITIGISGCEMPSCCAPSPPDGFTASIYTSEGEDYLELHAEDLIELYYFEKNNRKVMLEPHIAFLRDTTILYSDSVAWMSDRGIKDFYLNVNNDTDTLYVDVRKSKFRSVRLNGKEGIRSTNPHASSRFHLIKE